LKISSFSLPFVPVAIAALAFVSYGQAAPATRQATSQASGQTPAPAASSAHDTHHHPAPTNLKVLPKDTTGEQVHDLMHEWEADLGVTCKTCHVENPKDIGPNGRPRLNYADDSKDEKRTARLMYQMVENINGNYIAKIDNSGLPVTCGTCHQGHLSPEPYSAEDKAKHASVETGTKGAAGR
jgi:hypothetical protein